ncbi:MAG: hypothetical protein GF387_02115 [Candidatus Portnoybacteria bacterium]|nr:hypothetical protein [Candidatus Portnoybacteria bacterium]
MKIRIDHIAKIEGHASFTADIAKGDMKSARIKIEEGARLFEGIMQNRKDEEIPELGSRICGVCPVVHSLTGFKSIESAYNISVPEPAKTLRKLMMMGQLINSHSLHLFFFSLSDFFGFKSDLELINEYPKKTNDAVKIRDVGNRIVEIIGGRTVHPLTPAIGGMRKKPEKQKLEKLLKDCKNTLPKVIKLSEFFNQLKYPEFTRKTMHASLTSQDEYAIYEGNIKIDNKTFKPEEFITHVKEFQSYDKVAKRTKFNEETYLTGALSRINNNKEKLNKEAKKLLSKSNIETPCHNPFYNILAQAIELIHCFEESIKLLEKAIKEEENIRREPMGRTGKGIGAIEAPRGTLFYECSIEDGITKKVNIITPTAQNMANLEGDLEDFEEMHNFDKLSKKERQDKIKMLIRAYDPCVTCSVH